MKLKISELKSNPFKKEINKGKLDEDTIKKIRANIKELGLMGALPIFKKDNEYFLINGHHRLEALKREFGKNYDVEVIIHNYSEEQVLRGMVIENLTQRNNEFREEVENLILIRKYLRANSLSETARDKFHKGDYFQTGIKEISKWLNISGEVMASGRISQLLSIADNLDEELLEKVKKGKTTSLENQEEGILPVRDALSISRIEDKKEQKKIANIILNSGVKRQADRDKLITIYKELPQEQKQEILNGKTQIKDLQKVEQEPKTNGEMALTFNKKATELILEMRTLRKTLWQFRKEKLFDNFTPSQRHSFKDRLTNVKKEYTMLIDELENSIKVL